MPGADETKSDRTAGYGAAEPLRHGDREKPGDRRERGGHGGLLVDRLADQPGVRDPGLALQIAVALEGEEDGDLGSRRFGRNPGAAGAGAESLPEFCSVFPGSASAAAAGPASVGASASATTLS
jgi:hypothetical protein